jgi:outer membrane protein assembly factor BamB
MRRCLLLLPFLVSLSPAADKTKIRAGDSDWPQWQGPDRTAISREKGLLQEWPKGGPKQLWKTTGLGTNFCTPTVATGRIFLMSNRDAGTQTDKKGKKVQNEYVIALDEKDGKEIWATLIGPERANGGGYRGPRCSPTVDGSQIYALGLNGDLLCLDFESGDIRWRKDLRKDFQGAPGGWGYCESPLIDGDRLICTPGGKTSTLVALDKKSGDLIWKGVVPKGDGAGYASIIKATVEGKTQYMQFLSGGVVGLSEDGRFLWRYDHPHNGTANCSTAIYSDGYVFAASGYGTGGGLAKLNKDGDKYEAKEEYFTKNMKNHHGGMVLLNGYLYGSNEGELVCLDYRTGKVQWSDREPGKGSIACADGRLYYRNEGGPIYLIEVNPSKYIQCGKFSPPRSGSAAWPHPVIANGKLYIQDQDMLLCYDIKQR